MGIVEKFINYLTAEKQYSKLTVSAYYSDICQFLLYIGVEERDFELKDISATELRSFVMHLKEMGLKSRSVNRKMSTLKSLFNYGIRSGYITKDPTQKISLLKQEKNLPVFVPLSDMKRVQGNFLELTDDFITERNTLIFLLIYATGVRVSELVSMEIADLSFEPCEVKVLGKGNKERIVPIIPILEEKIKNYIKISENIFLNRKKTLFLSNKGGIICRSGVYRIVNQLLRAIGVDGKCSPHVLRHSFATHLLNRGAGIESVRELLGHANLSATQIYTHNNIGILVEKYNKSHPRAKDEE